MKYIFYTLIALFTVSHSYAQDVAVTSSSEVQTLLSPKTRVGGYLSLENQFKDFGESFPGIYSGARVGAVFNRYLFIGFGAYGLVNEVNLRELLEEGEELRINTGFAGLSVEPILFPKKVVHLTFPMFAGVGLAEVKEWGNDRFIYDDDLFWTFQLGANLEFNVTKWFRISGGAYFNDTEDFDLQSTPSSVLEGLSFGGSLKFGRF